MNINLDANTPGERIVLAVVLLGLLADLMDIEWTKAPQAEPMTIEQCAWLCGERDVKRVEAFACECFDPRPTPSRQ